MPNDRNDATQFFLLQKLKSALLWCIYVFHTYLIVKIQQLVAPRAIRQSCITPSDLECMLCDETVEPQALPLSLLQEITNGFCDEQQIGSGGFAVVYKGQLNNGIVVVKKMSVPYKYEEEFQREVECLMMARHRNVVRFLRYCKDTKGTMARHKGKFVMADVLQRLLCFEYLHKGSLREYITGLHYLHEENIVHFDLKPENILLDTNLVAKISDFGLSRCFIGETESRVISKIVGTRGYLAPECLEQDAQVKLRNSYRLDIYSLGVVLMEILTGEKKEHHVIDNVLERWSNMLEKSQRNRQLEQVRVCAEIGIECTNLNPVKRPDTQYIINRLNGIETKDEYIRTDVVTTANLDKLYETMHCLNLDIKRFFEFCSIFPRGSRLRGKELARMWIAQGYVKTSCASDDMEDIAGGYIQELVSCSFLQPIAISCDTVYFTIHDEMHDILDKVAGNCFRIENGGECWEGDVPQHTQHLFIQNYDEELIAHKVLELEFLCTLIVYVVGKNTPIKEKFIDSICKRLPKLRVLAIAFSQEHDLIEQPNEFSVPESIGQLRHIRYFAFRTQCSCKITLPSTLNRLEHTHLLDFGSGELVDSKLPWFGRPRSLETLPDFVVSNEQGCELKQLRELNKLRGGLYITGLRNVKSKGQALEANLAAKRLTYLTLCWGYSACTICSPEVEADVADGLCPPVGLKGLTLWGYEGRRYSDWMMGNHNDGPKYLQVLEICARRVAVPFSGLAEAFPHLRRLQLACCSWDALPDNMVHLTSLKDLSISGCENIRSLPSLPQSLEKFKLFKCNDQFMESCKTVGHPN